MDPTQAAGNAHEPTIVTNQTTNAPPTTNTLVIGTTETQARQEAQRRGLPRTCAVAIANAPDRLTPETHIITIRDPNDRAQQWATIEDHPHHID